MNTFLVKILTWGLSYIANALIIFNAGKQNEQNEQLRNNAEINSKQKAIASKPVTKPSILLKRMHDNKL